VAWNTVRKLGKSHMSRDSGHVFPVVDYLCSANRVY